MANGENIISNEILSLTTIADYYRRAVDSVNLLFSDRNPSYYSDYIGMSIFDIQLLKKEQSVFLEESFILELLACCEANLRKDLDYRRKKRKKDKYSREIRSEFKSKLLKSITFELLLEFWAKRIPLYKANTNMLIESVKYRNWLAHGRYWRIASRRDYCFNDLYILCISVLNYIKNLN